LNVLARRLLAIPEYRNFYFDTLQAIAVENGGEENWMFQDNQSVHELIRDAVAEDPNKLSTFAEFEAEVVYIQNFLRARTASLLEQLDRLRNPAPPPAE
jgi:hypothetical protein